MHAEYSRVLVKDGAAENELNAYRYDLVLFAGEARGLPAAARADETV